jgi:hypothetical protein
MSIFSSLGQVVRWGVHAQICYERIMIAQNGVMFLVVFLIFTVGDAFGGTYTVLGSYLKSFCKNKSLFQSISMV